MFAPELAYSPHPAPIGRSVEQLFDQERAIVRGYKLRKLIAVLDAIDRDEGEAGTWACLVPGVSQTLQDGKGLRTNKPGLYEIGVAKAPAIFDVPFDLMVIRRDPLRSRPSDCRVVSHHDVVKGLRPVGF